MMTAGGGEVQAHLAKLKKLESQSKPNKDTLLGMENQAGLLVQAYLYKHKTKSKMPAKVAQKPLSSRKTKEKKIEADLTRAKAKALKLAAKANKAQAKKDSKFKAVLRVK